VALVALQQKVQDGEWWVFWATPQLKTFKEDGLMLASQATLIALQ
jgi:hypothetical protein